MKNGDSPCSRRDVLGVIGWTSILVTVSGVQACSGPEAPTPSVAEPAEPRTGDEAGSESPQGGTAATADTEAPAATASTAEPATNTPSNGENLQRLEQSDPQAQSLAYVHNAETLDPAEQPRYEAGQACRNCALFLADAEAEWGACSIFAGKLVNGNGWCNVYSPKA